ncbi:histidine phosphatase family protein [Paenibacillus silvae]|jgi:broad specificity phosphatase PhoE|uniref:histidine phosphatase family protein n=1 Tax=Paenibacillus silvae TaxID=1325358 RepID=UPI0025A1ED10|nr:phosphoglycerate mutase family protein [Paenibacillus silvae]MDM5279060.1 phosphoglycerate mutase family protein [Paenibacillus silvae]
MDITFIRHGHAEHLLNYPSELNRLHPGLTAKGKEQITALCKLIQVKPDDTIVVSPTKRTLETVELLTSSARGRVMISPLVGPRMFPQDSGYTPLGCDQIYSRAEVGRLYPDIQVIDVGVNDWEESINQMHARRFTLLAESLLAWCRKQKGHIFMVSHDGTITNYRMLLGEQGLTRNDFLGEAGYCTIRHV